MRRVLVTGMGGHLGTRVAQLLEERSDVGEILGIDFVPPRRRLRRSAFRRIDPRDRDRLEEAVLDFAPTAVAHFGVYEPGARSSFRSAVERTHACTVGTLGAAARAGSLERVAVRSGIEVYGRGAGRPLVPDEDAPLAPTTPYGHLCIEVESVAAGLHRRLDVPVAGLRMAPVAGSSVPSPLGRVLRLPAVPVPACSDPPFSLLHQDDAARAMVDALGRGHHGPLNVVGPGAASPWQVVRLGGRVPVPVLGPGWAVAVRLAEVAGAPVPPHVLELLRMGRTADGGRAVDVLGLTDLRSTQEVCTELYEWATVTRLRPVAAVA
ncbi:MAG: NAD-dependent epimerase/dehydratase family protein [Acidimicrobiia bacterium]|nr:NAD-dependent epimerase/dehydratase family protein [Acidimicrobiia bacterium]